MCWMAENLRPFLIVEDHAFRSLMMTGRPGYFLPHWTTISHDVCMVFATTWKHVASMLKVSVCFD